MNNRQDPDQGHKFIPFIHVNLLLVLILKTQVGNGFVLSPQSSVLCP